MKYFLIALLAIFPLRYLFSQIFEDIEFGTDTTLEVMTWNIEWFPSNGQITIDYVSEIIAQLEVDVIAVQEIDDYQSFLDMVETLNGWEGFATNTGYLNLGYIYNPEFVQMQEIYQIYPNNNRELPRKPLIMELLFDGNKYIIINNHLKCCGDGIMNTSDPWDEETRRYDACVLIDEYIDDNFADDNVIVLGDLNDLLTDELPNNVFQVFFDDPENYLFTDMAIAEGSPANWSYPSWPSHLDHILISNELFDEFESESSVSTTLRIDDCFEGGFWEYEQNISDHRPVALKFYPIQCNTSVFDLCRANEIRVFPNPFLTSATINFEPAHENTVLEISDISGRPIVKEVFTSGQTEFIWERNSLPPGVYLLQLKGNHHILPSKKIILL